MEALGCVRYEAVTGRTPCEGETPFAGAYQHVQEDPVPPTQDVDVQHRHVTNRNVILQDTRNVGFLVDDGIVLDVDAGA